MELRFNREALCAADDIYGHEIVLNFEKSTTLEQIMNKIIEINYLPKDFLWEQIDKVRIFLLQLKPKILNWRELNPNKKFTDDIFKILINN